MINIHYNIYRCVLALATALMLTGCADTLDRIFGNEVEFEEGEKVMFTTHLPNIASVSSRAYSPDNELLKSYSTINQDYTLKLKMVEENDIDLGTCTYKPVLKEEGTSYYDYGKLYATPEESEGEFYWNSNVKKYAFEATAGTTTLEADQSTQEKWLAQDRLHGYAFAPLLDDTKDGDDKSVDKINALNYHTNKEWGALNKAWLNATDEENQMHELEDYKQIPLFLQHERSWITLILKAGNGVSREALKFENAQKNISVTFYNYANGVGTPLVLDKPLLKKTTVDYKVKDKNGEEQSGVETTSFNVIVDPHNYTGDNASKDKIAAISIAGLKFSFFAANDINYSNSDAATEEQKRAMAAYDLKPGKHLTITATLSTDRIVFITAWIEDWTEVATSTICDDYGLNGDPILINSRQDLIDFLNSDDLNKSGNVAIVVANSLDLDKKITNEYYQEEDEIPAGKKVGDIKNTITTDEPWSTYASKTLKATLNMAGAKFTTSSQFLGTIESSGSIINGTIVMNNATVESAIADTNKGTLERITVTPSGAAKASRGGLVVTNNGIIYQCNSTLPVYGTVPDGSTVYIGGIAAESVMPTTSSTMAVIDACTVNAPVKGDNNVKAAGGIVGHAEGRVTNNVNEYGITLLQPDQYKNIIGAKADKELRASNNSWPTLALNKLDDSSAQNANANTTAQYHNVLDSQEELKALLSNQNNSSDKKYRISADFTVSSEFWKRSDGTFIGQQHDDIATHDEQQSNGNLYCELDGNHKTITLDGTATVEVPTTESGGKATAYETKTTSAMLFSNITGSVHDLTIYLAKPLIATPSVNNAADKVLNSTDAIAPLAYSVRGATAKVANIKVKMADDAYIQAALPAGLVCWASDGGTIDNCQVKGKIQAWLPNAHTSSGSESGSSDARRYAGGIVASASKATIKNCIFHSADNTLIEAKTTKSGATVFYGGILGGTVVKDISGTQENPAVSIIDCISWLAPDKDAEPNKGAIVGRAQFTSTTDSHNHNGTVTSGDNKCQGNWWNTTYKGVADILQGETIEGVIGKCNGATPTIDNNY